MPRTSVTYDAQLATLQAEEATLQEQKREIERRLRKNATAQRELHAQQLARERNQLGALAQASGLTLEQLKDLLARAQLGREEE